MNYDQTKFCTYDLKYVTSVSPSASAIIVVIDEAALTVGLSSNLAYKDTS
jgi:hypothetical protein